MSAIKRIIPVTLFLTATSAAISANSIVSEIAPYVYPQNNPASPAGFTYMPDGESYLQPNDDNTKIIRYATVSGEEIETVFDATHTRESSIASFEGFTVSPQGNKLLIHTNSQSIYRHSFKAQYYVYDIRRNILKPLSREKALQQSPVFSPDERAVAFVADNDIRMRKLDYDTEIVVTTDGEYGKIINGVPDWSYEEEFSTTVSMAWSADSQTLCFIKYNEEEVPSYSLPIYQSACNPQQQYALYPGSFSYKYPVAGEKNSIVSLHSYDLSTRKIKDITLGAGSVDYIPRIAYAKGSSEQLLAVTLNREQNRMEIYSVNPKSTVAKSLLVEKTDAWIMPETYENMTLTDNSLIILSDRSGFTHLYEYSYNGSLLRQITDGNYDVTACYGADANGNIYYQSAKSSPLNRVVSKFDRKGKTTDITAADKTSSASFSLMLNYCVMTVSDAVTPPAYTLLNSNGKTMRVLENNEEYAATFATVPQKEFFTFNSDGYELNGYIIRPAGFSESTKYPVIMTQYSGPGSQSVLNRWSMDWEYFAAEKGFIVVCVDGRGTGGRGRDFRTTVYRNLGYYETIDQINAARFISTLPYVDANRIGMCGWSYGGYETLMCISAANSPFAAAVAIAPVTDWRYYDTIYSERYMLTPQANEDGYNQSAPILKTASVNCPLLIMYGTSDDNVHPANSIEYVSALQCHNILCDMLVFPNMNHSIYGCNSRAMVYGNMINHFNRHL